MDELDEHPEPGFVFDHIGGDESLFLYASASPDRLANAAELDEFPSDLPAASSDSSEWESALSQPRELKGRELTKYLRAQHAKLNDFTTVSTGIRKFFRSDVINKGFLSTLKEDCKVFTRLWHHAFGLLEVLMHDLCDAVLKRHTASMPKMDITFFRHIFMAVSCIGDGTVGQKLDDNLLLAKDTWMELAGKPQLTDRSHASSIIEQLAVRMRTTVKNYVVENFTKRVVSWCQAKVDMVLKNFELPHNRALALRMAITVMTGKSAMPRYGRHYEPAILSRLDYFCQEHPLPRDVHITDHKLKTQWESFYPSLYLIINGLENYRSVVPEEASSEPLAQSGPELGLENNMPESSTIDTLDTHLEQDLQDLLRTKKQVKHAQANKRWREKKKLREEERAQLHEERVQLQEQTNLEKKNIARDRKEKELRWKEEGEKMRKACQKTSSKRPRRLKGKNLLFCLVPQPSYSTKYLPIDSRGATELILRHNAVVTSHMANMAGRTEGGLEHTEPSRHLIDTTNLGPDSVWDMLVDEQQLKKVATGAKHFDRFVQVNGEEVKAKCYKAKTKEVASYTSPLLDAPLESIPVIPETVDQETQQRKKSKIQVRGEWIPQSGGIQNPPLDFTNLGITSDLDDLHVAACDPGMRSIATVVVRGDSKSDPNVISLSSKWFSSKTGQTALRKWLQRRLGCAPEGLQKRLSDLPGTKTVVWEKKSRSLQAKAAVLEDALQHYGEPCVARRHRQVMVKKQKALTEMVKRVTGGRSKDHVLVFFGSGFKGWARSCISRNMGPVQELLKKLQDSAIVVLVDEHRSSKVCCVCDNELEQARVATLVGNTRRPFALKFCAHCQQYWDRDVNAAKNLLRIGESSARGEDRIPSLNRQKYISQLKENQGLIHAIEEEAEDLAWSEEEELFFEEGEDAGQQLQHDSFYGIGYLGEEQREGIDYPET